RTALGKEGLSIGPQPRIIPRAGAHLPKHELFMQPQYSIVVFSHLRWNFVYQRPQHLLSRLAASRPVFFVEEPELDGEGPVRWERSTPQPNVVVLRPRTPIPEPGFTA